MRPGREMDTEIAKLVFGHRVWAQSKVLYENAEKGDRPLRNYSREIEWAFEVVKKTKMTLIPIEGGQWFAFVGPQAQEGWESPERVLEFLKAGHFEGCGAAVGDNIPIVICEAALRAMEKRNAESTAVDTTAEPIEAAEEPAPIHLVKDEESALPPTHH